MERLFEVLYEDPDLLALNKPAGLVCHPTKGDVYSSLVSRVREYFHGRLPAHLVNRLDRETSGVVIVAKTPESSKELKRIWESRRVEKTYWSIVHGCVREESGQVNARLGKDESSEVAIRDWVRPDGAEALTDYWREGCFRREGELFSILRVQPETGRKHQIRIHLASIGHPIVGDKMYGLDPRYYLAFVQDRLTEEDWRRLRLPNHALHAGEVRFDWRGRPWHFRATAEPWFREFIAGGEPVDCNTGLPK